MILDTREAIGPGTALAVRLMVDELAGPEGITSEVEGREVLEMLGELPDLWDVQLGHYDIDSRSSRFAKEGAQEPYVAFVKKLTTKPVVGVGRFTSPDTMVSQIRRGVLDMIGAARPSIADPFLPRKIETGDLDDIRECIGCNICVASNGVGVPLRCTQNPTMGEEWRRGWHPEVIAQKKTDASVLVVGAGPAGLEAARALGQRGYDVHLAEATDDLGGRVAQESRLPGLAEWVRVRDWRVGQIQRMANVTVYRASQLSAAEIREFGFAHVVIATGAKWRKDGVARAHVRAIPGSDAANVFTPEDIFAGAEIPSPVLVFDDDHYYMGGVIAEALRSRGLDVTLVTPAGDVSAWTTASLEQPYIQARIINAGITVMTGHILARVGADIMEIACTYTGTTCTRAAKAAVMVTSRLPDDTLYRELTTDPVTLATAGIRSVLAIGDCRNPGTIAAAVHAGHRYARELDEPPPGDVPFRVEHVRHE
jgi:dimethylamine/trimethylamine dehydrogenase